MSEVRLQPIAPGVFLLPAPQVNAYVLVDDDGRVTLVDTGLPGRAERLAAGLAGIGRTIEDVTAILVTHHHADHTGSAEEVARRSGARVYAGAADAPGVRGDAPAHPPTLPGALRPLTPVMRAVLPRAERTRVDHEISREETLPVHAGIRSVPTPGHTPGHTAYLARTSSGAVLFVGDACGHRGGDRAEVRRGWFNQPTTAVHDSIATLASLDFDVAAFGHGRVLTDGATAFRRYLDRTATRG